MLKEEKISKVITVCKRFCDDCGKQIGRQDMACSVAKCEICGKDLCNKCIGYEEYNTGDYRTVYCSKCWEIGTDYRNKIEKLESEIDSLDEEWHKKCNSFNK